MSNLSIPGSLAELTPGWLTHALRAGGAINSANVISAKTQAIGAGTGLMSSIGRVDLEYDRPEAGAPKI